MALTTLVPMHKNNTSSIHVVTSQTGECHINSYIHDFQVDSYAAYSRTNAMYMCIWDLTVT